MAKLIPFEKLEVGRRYVEQWSAGIRMYTLTILEKPDDEHFVGEYELHDGLSFSYWKQLMKKRPEYRYWDAMPTSEDMEDNPWSVNAAVCL